MNTTAKYDSDVCDSLADELKQICLNCDRPHCVGKCRRYDEASRAFYQKQGKKNRVGKKPKHYDFFGEMLTAEGIGRRLGVDGNTIRKRLREGWTSEQLREHYGGIGE